MDKNRDDSCKFASKDTAEAYKSLLTNAKLQKEVFANTYNTPFVLYKNGVLNLKNMKLLPFSPDYEFTSGINASYDEGSEGDMFNTYIDFVTESNPKLKDLIQEIMGYALSNYTFLRKAFIFLGVKGTGKSTLLQILNSLCENNGKCSVPITYMNHEYYIAKILNSKLNIVPDLPKDPIKDISRFNSLVSDSDSETRRNPYEKPITKRCRTKILFGTNHHLQFSGPSKEDINAFFTGQFIFPFANSLKNGYMDTAI